MYFFCFRADNIFIIIVGEITLYSNNILRNYKSYISLCYYKIQKKYKNLNRKNNRNESLNNNEQCIFDNFYIVKEAYEIVCQQVNTKIVIDNYKKIGRYKLPTVFCVLEEELSNSAPWEVLKTFTKKINITDSESLLISIYCKRYQNQFERIKRR